MVAQNAILLFLPVRSSFCRTKSAGKFLCVKIFRGRVVATSFLYLAVHRRNAGDVTIYLKFSFKVTHPFRKRFRLIVPQPRELTKKFNYKSLIRSRQCTFHRAIDEPCALLLSPPKGGSKWEFLHFALPFISSLQVIVGTSHLVCRLIIASPILRTTNCPWKGRGHVTWSL